MNSKYVLITYTIIPRDNRITHIKGWRDIPNSTQYNESIGFKNNIKANDLQTAKMILDTRSKTLVKNSFDSLWMCCWRTDSPSACSDLYS